MLARQRVDLLVDPGTAFLELSPLAANCLYGGDEAIAKSLNLPLVVSDNFSDAYGGPLTLLGRHLLRGLDVPHELFTPLVV